MAKYGKVIQAHRKNNHMTQANLGEKLNVTYQAVSKWEKDLSIPDLPTLQKLVAIFNITLEEFIKECELNEDNKPKVDKMFLCSVLNREFREDEIDSFEPYIVSKEAREKYLKELEEIRKV